RIGARRVWNNNPDLEMPDQIFVEVSPGVDLDHRAGAETAQCPVATATPGIAGGAVINGGVQTCRRRTYDRPGCHDSNYSV
ncbi:MAG: hypothetical protein QNJ48_13235, partial [Desulfobacterales bacterium]|nr:hypothetical protein [Desulfobacterales bacterium]